MALPGSVGESRRGAAGSRGSRNGGPRVAELSGSERGAPDGRNGETRAPTETYDMGSSGGAMGGHHGAERSHDAPHDATSGYTGGSGLGGGLPPRFLGGDDMEQAFQSSNGAAEEDDDLRDEFSGPKLASQSMLLDGYDEGMTMNVSFHPKSFAFCMLVEMLGVFAIPLVYFVEGCRGLRNRSLLPVTPGKHGWLFSYFFFQTTVGTTAELLVLVPIFQNGAIGGGELMPNVHRIELVAALSLLAMRALVVATKYGLWEPRWMQRMRDDEIPHEVFARQLLGQGWSVPPRANLDFYMQESVLRLGYNSESLRFHVYADDVTHPPERPCACAADVQRGHTPRECGVLPMGDVATVTLPHVVRPIVYKAFSLSVAGKFTNLVHMGLALTMALLPSFLRLYEGRPFFGATTEETCAIVGAVLIVTVMLMANLMFLTLSVIDVARRWLAARYLRGLGLRVFGAPEQVVKDLVPQEDRTHVDLTSPSNGAVLAKPEAGWQGSSGSRRRNTEQVLSRVGKSVRSIVGGTGHANVFVPLCPNNVNAWMLARRIIFEIGLQFQKRMQLFIAFFLAVTAGILVYMLIEINENGEMGFATAVITGCYLLQIVGTLLPFLAFAVAVNDLEAKEHMAVLTRHAALCQWRATSSGDAASRGAASRVSEAVANCIDMLLHDKRLTPGRVLGVRVNLAILGSVGSLLLSALFVAFRQVTGFDCAGLC